MKSAVTRRDAMYWYFELLEKTQNGYIYRYSTENDALDGLIECDLKSGDMWVVRPSEADEYQNKKSKEFCGLHPEQSYSEITFTPEEEEKYKDLFAEVDKW